MHQIVAKLLYRLQEKQGARGERGEETKEEKRRKQKEVLVLMGRGKLDRGFRAGVYDLTPLWRYQEACEVVRHNGCFVVREILRNRNEVVYRLAIDSCKIAIAVLHTHSATGKSADCSFMIIDPRPGGFRDSRLHEHPHLPGPHGPP